MVWLSLRNMNAPPPTASSKVTVPNRTEPVAHLHTRTDNSASQDVREHSHQAESVAMSALAEKGNHEINTCTNSTTASSSRLSSLLSRSTQPIRREHENRPMKRSKVDVEAIFSRLSEEQKEIVCKPVISDPIVVIAGAGTGKTAVIVGRILHLVFKCNVHPSQILAITFTRKATAEMSSRLERVLGEAQNSVVVENLHRLALHALQECGVGKDAFGFRMTSQVQLLNESDEKCLMEYVCLRILLKVGGIPSHEEIVEVLKLGDKILGDSEEDEEEEEEEARHQQKLSSSTTSMLAFANGNLAFVPNRFRPAVSTNGCPRPVVKSQIVNTAKGMVTEVMTRMIPPAEVGRKYGKELGQVFHLYRACLNSLKMATMDGLIPAFIRLVKAEAQVRRALQQRHRYIFADEVQDLSPAELEMLLLLSKREEPLSGDSHQLVCVGDEDQSIYSFRSGSSSHVGMFQQIQRLFPKATVAFLRTNYRCPLQIVNSANSLINHNQQRVSAKSAMVSHHPDVRNDNGDVQNEEDSITLLPCGDTAQEAQKVGDKISELQRMYPSKTIGILARSNRALKPMELELRRRRIPLRMEESRYCQTNVDTSISEKQQRKRSSFGCTTKRKLTPGNDMAIQATIAYMKLALENGQNSNSDVCAKMSVDALDKLFTICWTRPRNQGLGKKTLEALSALRRTEQQTLLSVATMVAESAASVRSFPAAKVEAVSRLMNRFKLLGELSKSPQITISDFFTETYRMYFEADDRHQRYRLDREQAESADHLFKLALVDAQTIENELLGSANLLHQVNRLEQALNQENCSKPDNDASLAGSALFLGTIHQAKGLEFDFVFLLRFNEGVLPTARLSVPTMMGSFSSDDHLDGDEESELVRIEEERRCTYVALTRTKKRLFISFVTRDDEAATMLLPSRFLKELGNISGNSVVKASPTVL